MRMIVLRVAHFSIDEDRWVHNVDDDGSATAQILLLCNEIGELSLVDSEEEP